MELYRTPTPEAGNGTWGCVWIVADKNATRVELLDWRWPDPIVNEIGGRYGRVLEKRRFVSGDPNLNKPGVVDHPFQYIRIYAGDDLIEEAHAPWFQPIEEAGLREAMERIRYDSEN